MPSLTVHTVRFYNSLYIIHDPVWNERRKSRVLLTRGALDRDRRLRRLADPHGRQIFSDGQPEVIKVSTENLLADKRYVAWPKRATPRERERDLRRKLTLHLPLSLPPSLKYHLDMASTDLGAPLTI